MNDVKFTGYDSVFATRLRELMSGNGTTQKDLAGVTGITRQAISQYMDGSVQPNIEKLYKISEFFEVSADYLLGLSDVKSFDIDIKAISEKTGLSEKSTNIFIELHTPRFAKECRNLVEWKDHSMEMINILIESGWLKTILFDLDLYFYNIVTVRELEKHIKNIISKKDLKERDEALSILEKNPTANSNDIDNFFGKYYIPLEDVIKMCFEKIPDQTMDLTVDKEYLSYKLCKDIEKEITILLAKNYERIKPLSYFNEGELEKAKEAMSELLIELGEEIAEATKKFEKDE